MKILRTLLTFLFLAVGLSALARAAEADASGKWEWSVSGPHGDITITAEFTHKEGALTGTVTARGNPAPISSASVKDGVVKFTVIRGEGYEVYYSGKLEGDRITGTMDRPGPEGRDVIPWNATRSH
jgi:hypothetical protein